MSLESILYFHLMFSLRADTRLASSCHWLVIGCCLTTRLTPSPADEKSLLIFLIFERRQAVILEKSNTK